MATVEERSDGRTVQLKKVRLSFAESLKDAKPTVAGGVPKHGANLILESSGAEFETNKKRVYAAIEAACEKQWKKPKAYVEIAEDNPKRVCFRKGERFKNQDGQVYGGYEGNMALTASGPRAGKFRPKMLDRHKREVAEADILDVMYNGTYVDAILSFYGTDEGGRGIFCSIEALRSHQEGEKTGGGVSVSADDFDDLDDDDSFGGGDDPLG